MIIMGGHHRAYQVAQGGGGGGTGGLLTLLPGETAATLPLVTVDTTLPATPGSVITVHAGGNFQTALNTAALGDVIELDAGATFSGNFTLPDKGAGTSWITIRPSNWASLPAQGTRMLPATAASLSLPILTVGNATAVLQANQAAHHYRFIGIEVTTSYTAGTHNGLIETGAVTQTTLAHVPHHLVFDRCYIHGLVGYGCKRGVNLNCSDGAVIESTVSDCHVIGQDSQAIAGTTGPGPFKIQNNYCEAAGENVFFGGADPSVANVVPSDIEIRGNHLYKPYSVYNAAGYSVKNLLEIKNGQRVLIENNVFDGSWVGGQEGSAMAFKSVNQDGGAPWCVCQDVTVRYNSIVNVGNGFNFAAAPEQDPSHMVTTHARRLTVHDNLIVGINAGVYVGSGRAALVLGDLRDVLFVHNTTMSPTVSMISFGGVTAHTSLRDNISGGGQYGVIGDNFASGSSTINQYMGDGIFSKNVIIGVNGAVYPAGSFFPANNAAVGFTNAGAGDYSLTSGSAYHNAANDGRDIGADIATITANTSGVV